MRVTCSNCKVPGALQGLPPGVVPERVLCGNCGATFKYRPSRYELIGQDYEGELSSVPFFLKPDWREPLAKPEPAPEPAWHPATPRRAIWIKTAPVKRLLEVLRIVRAYGGNAYYTGFGLTVEDLKAELATREHVPSKQEAAELRRKRAKSKSARSR